MWFKGNGRVLLNQSGFAAIIYKRRAIAVNGWLEEGGGRRLVAAAGRHGTDGAGRGTGRPIRP